MPLLGLEIVKAVEGDVAVWLSMLNGKPQDFYTVLVRSQYLLMGCGDVYDWQKVQM